LLRRLARDGQDIGNVIRTLRAGVDPAGDAVLQHHPRTFGAPPAMRVNIDQAGHNELAARIQHVGRVSGHISVDRGDAAG